MTTFTSPSLTAELAHRIEEFEAALAIDPGTDLTRFLPDRGDPLYFALLGELVRIDLETGWTTGRPRRLSTYLSRFPALLEQRGVLRSVAFEEYRQRRRAGEDASREDYRVVYDIDTNSWPNVPCDSEDEADEDDALPATNVVAPPRESEPVESKQSDGISSLASWQEAAASLPEAGTQFLGFRLIEELGRGAFGRVYRAEQSELSDRPVAIKVACDITRESRTLAQLQHPNIVPIYSFHRVGPFQAVCMPYLGRTTLADVLQDIRVMRTLPSSGREIHSTVNNRHSRTSPASSEKPASSAVKSGEWQTPPPRGSLAEIGSSASAHPAQSPDGWARLDGLPYVDAVLTLAVGLADGLAHAHRRGILHRDLKPANILLTDDGRPILLDFNLAEDVKIRDSATRAAVGGTLPYMASEHIEAFQQSRGQLDERCDVFSMGVILFELLTRRHPFPSHKGSPRETVPLMIVDRRRPPPGLREHNAAVSPGVEAIVRKCLAPNPADRYQTAEDLRDDLDRHLANRPLKHAGNPSIAELGRKWVRRHPRITSSAGIGIIAAVLLLIVSAGALYSRERSRGFEARAQLADHRAAFQDAQLFLDDRNQSRQGSDRSLERLRVVLSRYGIEDDGDLWLKTEAVRYLPEADREGVKRDVGETYYLMAQVSLSHAVGSQDASAAERAEHWNALAERYAADRLPRAIREQRAAIAEFKGDASEAKRLRAEAEAVPLESARDLFLVGSQFARQGKLRDALKHLQRATQLDPANYSAWFVRGSVHLMLEQGSIAASCFSSCVALRPEFAPGWLNRGLAFAQLRNVELARADYDRAIELDPNLTEALVLRAGLRSATGDDRGAEKDYTRALETSSAPVRLHFLRASVRDRLNDEAGAKTDRDAGFRLEPKDELGWLARAENEPDPAKALADVEHALKENPWSVFALQHKAHLLQERLNRPDEALAVLNRAVELHPDHVRTRSGRAVELARRGKRDAAHADAQAALLLETSEVNLYQIGCVYALTARTHPEDRLEAFRLLWAALKTGYGLEFVDADTDIDPIRKDPAFQKLLDQARAIHGAKPK